MRGLWTWSAVVALVATGAPARAEDEVILRDGSTIQGEVIEEGAEVVRVRVARGDDRVIIELPRAQVHWVRRLREEHARLERDAEAALVRGDVAAAVSAMQLVVAALPKDARAQRELGFALILANAHAEAAAALERAVALDPIDFEAHLQLAQSHERLGHPEAALSSYRRATLLGPRHTIAWRALARLLLAAGGARQREEALDALARASREAPDDEGIVLEQLAALLPGWTAGPAAGPDAQRARTVLEAHAGRRPASARATLALARLLAGQGEAGRGRDVAQRLAAREDLPRDVRERARAEAALHAWRADGAPGLAPPPFDVGAPGADPAWAAQGLDLLLADSPWPDADGRLLVARARVALRADRRDDAAAWLERAALTAPDVVSDALLLQEVLVELAPGPGRAPGPATFFGPQVATAKARRAVALVPWAPQAHETLGRALERDGAFEAAAAAYEAAAARAAQAERGRLEAAATAARDAHARKARTNGL